MIELLLESLRVGIDSIRSNKLRSFLTTLGIIIGVMTVIIVVSIIAGLQGKVQQVFSSIGSNVIYVQRSGWVSMGPRDWRARFRNYVDMDDFDRINMMSTTADEIGISLNRFLNVKYMDNTLEMINVEGITRNGLAVGNYQIDMGIGFSEDDIKDRRNVCLIGKDIKEKVFVNEDPINKWLTIDGKKFLVQGILAEKGSIMGSSQDEVVIIPYTTLMKYYPEVKRRVTITVTSQTPQETIEELRWIMRISHSLKPDEPDNFAINTSDALMEQWQSLTTAIFLIMIAVGSLTLVVGGIGIMNIMLVSVSERTREIGIRKSIGARNKEILLQFLLESITVSVTGGIIGLISGFLIAFLVSKVSNLPFAMPLWSVLLGFLFSVSAGLFFGIYPARKAAKLDPVECLRYE